MRFGVNFFPVFDPEKCSAADYYEQNLELISLAEQLGFEHAQTVEHYGSPYGGYSPDPVTFLAAAAARTSTIRIVTGAVIPAFTHPIKLAGKLAMLDHLSRGRLDVGFGRGFLPAEFAAFEVPMDSSRARFAEGVEACRRLWTEEDLVFDGQFHRFGPVTLLPRPYQQPHPPIFVAAATSAESAAAAGAAGYHLQIVPSVTSAEQLGRILDGYREAWRAAGHEAGAHRIQIKYTCYVDEDRDTALRRAETHERSYAAHMAAAVAPLAGTSNADYPGYEAFADKAAGYNFADALAARKLFAGDPADILDQIASVRDAYGTDLTMSLQFNPGLTGRRQAAASLRLFAAQVMPAFADLPAARA
jgi:alkanesulfonate monooxygenase SsuD/methylene tetrahydromethanopterin reductase-like flavin-dependent oxidoreductase (luciferase family)